MPMPSPSIALLRTQSDARLVALAAGGHERAFEAIVERYRRQLLRHARRHLPEARAEDALQQAFVSAWTALRRGDEVRELRPWLHRIVHNAALNALRAPGYDYEELRAPQLSMGRASLTPKPHAFRPGSSRE
jgi:DNA-directed RNA polymerase specialized sigma24 family protein